MSLFAVKPTQSVRALRDLRPPKVTKGAFMLRGDLRRAKPAAEQVSIAESEARHRTVLGSLAHGVVLQDADGRLMSANAAAYALLHIPEPPPPPGPTEPPGPRRPEDDRPAFPLAGEDRPAMRALRTGQVQREVTFALPGGDGRPAWVSVTAVPVLDGDGTPRAVVSAVSDGTAGREQELALRRSEELFRLTMEHTPIGVALLALNGRFLRVNRMLCRQFGYRPDELHARSVYDLVHPEDLEESSTLIRQLLSGEQESVQLERRYLGHGGMVVWGLLSVAVVRDDDGVPLHLLMQLEDLSEIRKANELLTHLALHDPLTGLANRTLLVDRIQKALDRSRRTGRLVAVLIADLDHFRVVNDSLGHELGDAVLVEVSRRISGALRATDTAGRLGGDEYVIVCEDVVDEQEAIVVAERIQQAVGVPADVDGRIVVPRLSVGIALSGPANADPLTMLRDADTATYRAKDNGRNRWDISDVTLRRRAMERLDIEHALRSGLQAGEMRLHFQRIVDLSSRAVVGREALLRWHHPERGLLGPADFLHVAEESGLIADIGRWVLAEAARVAARAEDGAGYVSVNVSPHQVARPGLADAVEAALADAGLPAERLMVELTESVMLSADPAARKELSLLDELGVRIVVDDFGTGFSALSYLRDLPVSGIKVDRSFTAGLGRDTQCERIVEAVTGLGRGLGVDVIVEGVETEQQRRMLVDIGCEHAQGYLFGRPVPTFAD
jgi:diguanylate cyclase (GGDEF)-like protein/PAS domain S-box-containing protein